MIGLDEKGAIVLREKVSGAGLPLDLSTYRQTPNLDRSRHGHALRGP